MVSKIDMEHMRKWDKNYQDCPECGAPLMVLNVWHRKCPLCGIQVDLREDPPKIVKTERKVGEE